MITYDRIIFKEIKSPELSDIERIATEMRAVGNYDDDIAKQLSIKEEKVQSLISDTYLDLFRKALPIDEGKILALHNAHWNPKDIAEDCYTTVTVVLNVIKNRLGVATA